MRISGIWSLDNTLPRKSFAICEYVNALFNHRREMATQIIFFLFFFLYIHSNLDFLHSSYDGGSIKRSKLESVVVYTLHFTVHALFIA